MEEDHTALLSAIQLLDPDTDLDSANHTVLNLVQEWISNEKAARSMRARPHSTDTDKVSEVKCCEELLSTGESKPSSTVGICSSSAEHWTTRDRESIGYPTQPSDKSLNREVLHHGDSNVSYLNASDALEGSQSFGEVVDMGPGEEDIVLFCCPYEECQGSITIPASQVNCGVFRHGVFKHNGRQIPPHSSKWKCDRLAEMNAVYGCAKPFRCRKCISYIEGSTVGKTVYTIEKCDYI
eukprot:CAMPEP_0185038352 /NCGR_PEP_ID=MMETSP1103-20130426/33898_1 /TAXON_ID=36769 /ORGANISM="Paraphysomonas bandaiensis, Strain Caron Lab Isolate" /LENGTH=237 /DNA_ID=CAMNT_0027576737 /DNA_START=650 /DNA_END=1363 /DNA_ORIENTATION=-